MFRRIVAVGLLVGGLTLGLAMLRAEELDARRRAGAAVLAGVGLVLNSVSVWRTTLAFRTWLRGLALIVALAGLLVVVGVWWSARTAAGAVLAAGAAVPMDLVAATAAAQWLAMAWLYVLASVAFLPPEKLGRSEPQSPRPAG